MSEWDVANMLALSLNELAISQITGYKRMIARPAVVI
jgi:hypothetical protein